MDSSAAGAERGSDDITEGRVKEERAHCPKQACQHHVPDEIAVELRAIRKFLFGGMQGG